MLFSLKLRKMLALLNLGEKDQYARNQQALLGWLARAREAVQKNEEATQESAADPKHSCKLVSLEKLMQIEARVEADFARIDSRLASSGKKNAADSLLRANSDLDSAEELYREVLASDPDNLKGKAHINSSAE